MGLFDKLFEKKYCEFCGEEIGLLGNRKLEDGNMCKKCAARLSPWFDERRHSTVEQIREQLAYREENQKAAAAFNVTRSYDGTKKLLFDDDAHKFTVTSSSGSGLEAANPDILDWSQITGCDLDVRDSRREIYTKDREGKNISYNPKRYEYMYNFRIKLRVNHPYFDDMSWDLNSGSVVMKFDMKNDYQSFLDDARIHGHAPSKKAVLVSQTMGALAGSVGAGVVAPPNDYDRYLKLGNEICEALEAARQAAADGYPAPAPAETPAAAPEPQENAAPQMQIPAKMTCPYCGAETTPDKEGRCEYCGSKLI